MKDGFIKVAAITPNLRVADVQYNIGEIKKWIKEAEKESAKIIVFPELCITGYSCQDLFLQDELLESARSALIEIKKYTEEIDAMIFVGLPVAIEGKLYNVAAAMNRGKILGIVPKIHLPNYNEFYEARHFYSGKELNTAINIEGKEVFKNKADVVVADGFAGNIVLKITESTASMLLKMIKNEFKSDIVGSIIGLMAKPFLRRILKRINWEVYGGMLLLGVNGISVIAHGRSSAYAMKNAVGAAVRVLNKDINSKISESINR